MTLLEASRLAESVYFDGLAAQRAFAVAFELYCESNDLDQEPTEDEEREIRLDRDYWARYDAKEEREGGEIDAWHYQ